MNVTVPLGVLAPDATVLTLAVKVTDCPGTDGLAEELMLVEVLPLLTVCARAADDPGLKLPSPPYCAVMECEPTDRAPVLKVAWPLLRVPVPRMVVPSEKVTAPVGVPPVDGLTAAVKVTDCPETEGFAEELTVVETLPLPLVVEATVTVCVRPVDVLPLKLPSPLYCAVMECEATDNALVVKEAWPLLRALEPRILTPS